MNILFKILCFLVVMFQSPIVISQEKETLEASVTKESTALNDGPYIFIKNGQLTEKSIRNGTIVTKELNINAFDTIYPPETSIYKGVEKIAALSDIHGQYDLAVEILVNNKVIDKKLNWNYGKGHFVIVGDIFDRGDKVMEMLWLIYKLEQQAEKAGGKVHYILGNHEYMVLHKDLRYLNEKYEQTSELLHTDYDVLFGNDTVLGRWLRSKSTILKLNDEIFVHGGVSKTFLSYQPFEIEAINAIMRSSIDRSKAEMKSTDFYEKFYGKTSLIWYRGYFQDDLPDEEVLELLDTLNSEHIVVGHCSNDTVVSLYNNKIFGVDSSIKNGKYGELLFIEGDTFSVGAKDGTKRPLD